MSYFANLTTGLTFLFRMAAKINAAELRSDIQAQAFFGLRSYGRAGSSLSTRHLTPHSLFSPTIEYCCNSHTIEYSTSTGLGVVQHLRIYLIDIQSHYKLVCPHH